MHDLVLRLLIQIIILLKLASSLESSFDYGDVVKGKGKSLYLITKPNIFPLNFNLFNQNFLRDFIKREFPDYYTFIKMGYNWTSVKKLPEELLMSIPTAETLPKVNDNPEGE